MRVWMQQSSLVLLLSWSVGAGAGLAYDENQPTPVAKWPPLLAQASKSDPAATLYDRARGELNRTNYRRAAELFQLVYEKHGNSSYAGDAYYWQAFALYKTGGEANYKRALALLEQQKARFPQASTRKDAEPLATRIQGELARLGDQDAAGEVTERATKPSETDLETRLDALNALMNLNPERATPILKQILAKRDPASTELRERALFILSQKGGEDVVDVLVDASKNDPSADVREKAAFWLSQVPGERSFAALTDILNNSQHIELREKAIFAISQHHSDQSLATLQRVATDPKQDESLREKAIFWIGQRENSFEFLSEIYDTLDSEDLKDKTIFAIAQSRSPANQNWLMQRMANTAEPIDLRKKALFWLGQQQDLDIRQLQEIYKRFPEAEMKEQVIFVASQRSEPEAVDFLIYVARNEKNPELRKKAIFWLGNSNDPRAARELERLINQ